MPRTKDDSTETFSWGALWTIVLLIALIVTAAYFLWYKPVHRGGAGNRERSAESHKLVRTAMQSRYFTFV